MSVSLKSLLLVFILMVSRLGSADVFSVSDPDGTEVEVIQYRADGNKLLLVLPSEHGVTEGLSQLAASLQKIGIETWIADPFSSLMLPNLESSLKKIPVSIYVRIIEQAIKTGKQTYLFSNDNGTENLLTAAHHWQLTSAQKTPRESLSGVILISPNFYITTPTAGNDGIIHPVVSATNLPVFIFLPAKSTLTLQIKHTVEALEQGGSDVFVQVLKDVRARFFFRNDATDTEIETFPKLSQKIDKAMSLTAHYAKPRTPRKTIVKSLPKRKKTTGTLQKYHGIVTPENFTVRDLNNRSYSLKDYYGKVIIVNFWASWCPPCVHEMPSMSALKDHVGAESFDILAINLGEAPEDIKAFLKKHPVNFPVLPDPGQGLAKDWKVFAFPTSYILDKKGDIRYSVAGGIDWNTDQVRKVIKDLLAE